MVLFTTDVSSSYKEEEDIFFDSYDDIHSTMDSMSSDESVVGYPTSQLRELNYEVWTKELMSISERRRRFLSVMGFSELFSSKFCSSPGPENTICDRMAGHIEMDATVSSSSDEGHEGHECPECLTPSPEFESFESCAKLYNQQKFRETDAEVKRSHSLDLRKNKQRKWWRSLTMCKNDVYVKNCKLPSKTMIAGVQHQRKRSKGFSTMSMRQQIQGHKGLIRTMKFNHSRKYLASAGEDCIVRVWQVREENNSFKHLNPEKDFKIDKIAIQEFHGHTSDILDLCWSKSDYLLSSSKDKTVCLWKVGSSGCLSVFKHNDYVTCVQFNPVTDKYFISGSIDGKVRIWGIAENHVVNWVHSGDIVTAICYRPDGGGFAVGSIEGGCWIYSDSGDNIQLDKKFYVHRGKKSFGKQITDLQFILDDSQRIIITSANSEVHVSDEVDVLRKFRGPRKFKGQSSASFTSDGKHVITVSEDSHVYMLNCKHAGSPSHKGDKLTFSCEPFFSESVSVAVPWSRANQGVLRSCSQSKDPECFPLGACFNADGQAATWPEELLSSASLTSDEDSQHHHHQDQCFTTPSAFVIVTASYDGVIRCYMNDGWSTRI